MSYPNDVTDAEWGEIKDFFIPVARRSMTGERCQEIRGRGPQDRPDRLGQTHARISVEGRSADPGPGKGFQVLPKRWFVERICGRLVFQRHLSKDYEHNPRTSGAMLYVAFSTLCRRA